MYGSGGLQSMDEMNLKRVPVGENAITATWRVRARLDVLLLPCAKIHIHSPSYSNWILRSLVPSYGLDPESAGLAGSFSVTP